MTETFRRYCLELFHNLVDSLKWGDGSFTNKELNFRKANFGQFISFAEVYEGGSTQNS